MSVQGNGRFWLENNPRKAFSLEKKRNQARMQLIYYLMEEGMSGDRTSRRWKKRSGGSHVGG